MFIPYIMYQSLFTKLLLRFISWGIGRTPTVPINAVQSHFILLESGNMFVVVMEIGLDLTFHFLVISEVLKKAYWLLEVENLDIRSNQIIKFLFVLYLISLILGLLPELWPDFISDVDKLTGAEVDNISIPDLPGRQVLASNQS